MYDDRNGGRNRGAASGRSSRRDLRSDAPGWAPSVHTRMEVDATDRQFLLSSTAHPAQAVGAREMRLLIYTTARNGEVLLKVRYFGRS
jgi:hypothetical protein